MIRTLKSNRITDVGQILREGTPLLFSLSLSLIKEKEVRAGQGRAPPPSLPFEYITVKKKRRKIAKK